MIADASILATGSAIQAALFYLGPSRYSAFSSCSGRRPSRARDQPRQRRHFADSVGFFFDTRRRLPTLADLMRDVRCRLIIDIQLAYLMPSHLALPPSLICDHAQRETPGRQPRPYTPGFIGRVLPFIQPATQLSTADRRRLRAYARRPRACYWPHFSALLFPLLHPPRLTASSAVASFARCLL